MAHSSHPDVRGPLGRGLRTSPRPEAAGGLRNAPGDRARGLRGFNREEPAAFVPPAIHTTPDDLVAPMQVVGLVATFFIVLMVGLILWSPFGSGAIRLPVEHSYVEFDAAPSLPGVQHALLDHEAPGHTVRLVFTS